jgi:hypothetical protein
MSGIARLYSAGTVDQWPKNVSSALLFGGMWTFPIPDLDRTDYLVVMGANPHASQGSLLAAPDLLARSTRSARAGGKVIVIDRAAPARRSTPTSGWRSARAPTRRSCSRSRRCYSRRAAYDRDGSPRSRTGSKQ